MPFFSDLNNIWVVALYPLLAFFIIVLGRTFGREKGLFAKKEISSALTIIATFLGLLHTVFGALPWLLHFPSGEAVQAIERNFTFLQAGDFRLSVGYLVDSMSVMMLFVVTFISLLIQIYTHGYMKHDAGYAKFFAYLALFNFSMLGLVLSTNLFQIYIFWELVGVSSYLLIGFWFTKPSAAAAAVKAFLMNRVGDFGFLFGILGILYFSYSLWNGYLAMPGHQDMALLSFRALPDMVRPIMHNAGLIDPNLFTIICILLFMGPMAKSAQVPLHTWLPDAMEGPTPISALIHAATMVAAGVYLIGRAYPLFSHSPLAMVFITLIGTLTAVIAASIALVQYDIKKALAYSTMSQLGFMVAAMGVGAFTAGLFHLFTHAFFKAMLFLCSGSVIHACEDEQDMRKMGGLAKKLPVTHLTYLIGTLAISGLLWTSGFWSKDMILASAKAYSPVIFWNLAVTAGLTSFYMFRTYFMTFHGKYRGEAHVHHEDPVMVTPLAILAIPSALIGLLLAGLSDPLFSHMASFGQYINFAGAELEHHTFLQAAMSEVGLLSTAFGLVGFGLAAFFYLVAPSVPEAIKNAPFLRSAFTLFTNKWYFDGLYQGFVDRVYLVFARGSANFDRSAIDGVVNGTGRTVMGTGYALREMQSGKVQTYIAILFFSVVTLALLLFYWLM
jgi:proton-translocating NADH-quinone oxidoreductase chain L